MTSLEELLEIDTPENVSFDYEVAGIGSRFLAALTDTLIIVLVILALAAVLFGVLGNWLDGFSDEAQFTYAAVFILLSFVVLWGYYIFFETTWSGQTPGKRWVGLRVVRLNGLPISVSEAVIRNIVRIIDFLPTGYGIGVVVMFIQPQARRLGDLAAGTLVVFERTAVSLDTLSSSITPYQAMLLGDVPEEIAALPLHLLPPQLIDQIDAFLGRRYELSNRYEIGRKLHHAAYEAMALTPDFQVRDDQREKEMQYFIAVYRQPRA